TKAVRASLKMRLIDFVGAPEHLIAQLIEGVSFIRHRRSKQRTDPADVAILRREMSGIANETGAKAPPGAASSTKRLAAAYVTL
ncbi:MAG TPA: hypothetical protein VMF32_11540, partial [Xanthobacteraceae bacterium]|nr:hypothetical protein [Xanthobacteraceae bacterium]